MNARTQIEFLYLLVSFGIVRGHMSAFSNEIVDEIYSDRVAHVIGIGLEGKSPHGDPFFF
jgi:hypothetical protein